MKYAEQLQAATDELVKLKQWRKVLINLQAELNKMRDLLPIRRDRFQHMEFDNLTRALILQLRVLGDRHPEIRVTMNQLAMAVEARRR